jgi:hypothetical protein
MSKKKQKKMWFYYTYFFFEKRNDNTSNTMQIKCFIPRKFLLFLQYIDISLLTLYGPVTDRVLKFWILRICVYGIEYFYKVHAQSVAVVKLTNPNIWAMNWQSNLVKRIKSSQALFLSRISFSVESNNEARKKNCSNENILFLRTDKNGDKNR